MAIWCVWVSRGARGRTVACQPEPDRRVETRLSTVDCCVECACRGGSAVVRAACNAEWSWRVAQNLSRGARPRPARGSVPARSRGARCSFFALSICRG